MDEVGRGTTVQDGLAIAFATVHQERYTDVARVDGVLRLSSCHCQHRYVLPRGKPEIQQTVAVYLYRLPARGDEPHLDTQEQQYRGACARRQDRSCGRE